MKFNFASLIPHALLLVSAVGIAEAVPAPNHDGIRTVTVVKYSTKYIPKTTIVIKSTIVKNIVNYKTTTKTSTKTSTKTATKTTTKTSTKTATVTKT